MTSSPNSLSAGCNMESETQQQQPSNGVDPLQPRQRRQPARAAKAHAAPGGGAEQAAADEKALEGVAAAGPGPAPHTDREARDRAAAELTALAQAAGWMGVPEGRLVSAGQRGACDACGRQPVVGRVRGLA